MNDIKIEILDHGYVCAVERWGSDQIIIESARMSTDKGFTGWGPNHICETCKQDTKSVQSTEKGYCESPGCGGRLRETEGDEKLLRYLYKNKHSTPFEFAGLTVEVQAPIFVFREWQRHRTQSFTEMSARYIKMPNLHYVPSIERIQNGAQSKSNKQGSSAFAVDMARAKDIRSSLIELQEDLYTQYENLIEAGMSNELARINTPVSRYSRMRATANLHNWLKFVTLRSAQNAQFEIREYSKAIESIIEKFFPRTYELFFLERSNC